MPKYIDRKEDLIYLDNRGVRVTKTWLRVENGTYAIANISSYTTGVARPAYIGPALTAFVGLVAAVFGLETATWIAAGVGGLLIALAIGWGVSLKPHYFLRIVSTGTETRLAKTRDKAYIESVIAAIHKAKLQRD